MTNPTLSSASSSSTTLYTDRGEPIQEEVRVAAARADARVDSDANTTLAPSDTAVGDAVKAVILVGGPSRGLQFRPLSLYHPKPLIPVGGKPMLYHQIHALARTFPNLVEVLIFGFFDAALFTEFLTSARDTLKIRIRYVRERDALGTAGGLEHFREDILAGDPAHFFVMNVDICCSFPLAEMLAHHKQRGGVATILAKRVGRKHAQKYGCMVARAETSEVVHYVDKPDTFRSDLISGGILLFTPDIFTELVSIRRRVTSEDEYVYWSGWHHV